MVMQFMSGILSKGNENQLMEKLLEALPSSHILLWAKCLTEYEDKELAKNTIKNDYRRYYDENKIEFSTLLDVDCIAASFLIDVISALNKEAHTSHQTFSEQTFNIKELEFVLSNLTQSGVRRLCNSLEKDFCVVTKLWLNTCRLNDECADCIRGLVSSKLTELTLSGNPITDSGIVSLSQALESTTCQVTSLYLNDYQITDAGIDSLSQALQSSTCQVSSLDLSYN